jgi:hypothetical protein
MIVIIDALSSFSFIPLYSLPCLASALRKEGRKEGNKAKQQGAKGEGM